MNSYILFAYNLIGCIQTICKLIWICISECIRYCLVDNFSEKDVIDGCFDRVCKVNILYVKIFQAIALSIDKVALHRHLHPHLLHKLKTFSDCVPYTPDEIDKSLLTTLETEYSLVVDSYTPLKSGMISLVFTGKTCSCIEKELESRDIIIKLQRNCIREKLVNGLDQLNK